MIDSIVSSTSFPSTSRAITVSQSSSLRTPSILTAIQQTSQRVSHAVEPVRIFAVPQAAGNGSSAMTRLPRGSLVDVLA